MTFSLFLSCPRILSGHPKCPTTNRLQINRLSQYGKPSQDLTRGAAVEELRDDLVKINTVCNLIPVTVPAIPRNLHKPVHHGGYFKGLDHTTGDRIDPDLHIDRVGRRAL